MYVRNSIMQMATQLMDLEKHCLSTPCLVCLLFTDRHSSRAEPECSTLLAAASILLLVLRSSHC